MCPEQLEVVYVVTNPAMPGMVKIGRTTLEDANTRIKQLYTPGVPVPFDLEYACKVNNSREVEQALHEAFAPYRVNPKREFFHIDPEQAIAILHLLHTEDATGEVEAQPETMEEDKESVVAGERLRKRRPKINFEKMGIPIGSVLKSTHGETVVTVSGPKKVLLGEQELALSAATSQILGTTYPVTPGRHWTVEGKLLADIYEETYSAYE